MEASQATSYDEVQYLGASFSNTHPEILATSALLRGIEAPPVETARVLELGCGRGGNIIPLAALLPRATFVGIDLSGRQIEEALSVAQGLGLSNIDLRAMDVMDVTPSFGTFDYIIAHGLFSWVPPQVQEKILEVCAGNLSPNGVAYISYNTYPGWHISEMFRNMMLFHIRKVSDPMEKVREVRAFMKFLSDTANPETSLWAVLLKEQSVYVEQAADWYLLHDDLEANNIPLYFHEFVERAQRHGLQYLTEERFGSPDEILSPEVWKVLDGYKLNRIEREQYLDFMRSGRFRRSLLCHAGVRLATQPVLEALERCRFRVHVRPVDLAAQPVPGIEESFVGEGDLSITTKDLRLRLLLHSLYEAWPRTLAFDDVMKALEPAVAGSPDPQGLVELILWKAAMARLIILHLTDPPIAMTVDEKPVGFPLARLLATRAGLVTNLLDQSLKLDAFDRAVLAPLDGTVAPQTLLPALREAVETGILVPRTPEGVDIPREEALARLPELLADSLRRLLTSAYLVEGS